MLLLTLSTVGIIRGFVLAIITLMDLISAKLSHFAQRVDNWTSNTYFGNLLAKLWWHKLRRKKYRRLDWLMVFASVSWTKSGEDRIVSFARSLPWYYLNNVLTKFSPLVLIVSESSVTSWILSRKLIRSLWILLLYWPEMSLTRFNSISKPSLYWFLILSLPRVPQAPYQGSSYSQTLAQKNPQAVMEGWCRTLP